MSMTSGESRASVRTRSSAGRPIGSGWPAVSASADWASDSRHIVFISTKQGTDVLQIYDTKKRRIVRTLKTELTAIANPSFSPDGRWVVFSALENGEGDLFVVDNGELVARWSVFQDRG